MTRTIRSEWSTLSTIGCRFCAVQEREIDLYFLEASQLYRLPSSAVNAVLAPAAPIPTLSHMALILLALLVLVATSRPWRRTWSLARLNFISLDRGGANSLAVRYHSSPQTVSADKL